MLAARAMYARTGADRFAELWRASARELLARQEEDGLWTQDLFGRHQRVIGAAHGFAGNILALSAARGSLITASAAIEEKVMPIDSYIAKFVFGPCKIKDWDAVWLTVRSALLTDEGSRKDFRAQLSFS